MSTPSSSFAQSTGNPRVQTYDRYCQGLFQLLDRKQEIESKCPDHKLDDHEEYDRVLTQIDELQFRMDTIVENIIHNEEEEEFYREIPLGDGFNPA